MIKGLRQYQSMPGAGVIFVGFLINLGRVMNLIIGLLFIFPMGGLIFSLVSFLQDRRE